jgi:hypothetical protein
MTGPLPRLPTEYCMVFLRTMYVWHAIALFTKDRYGDYLKPTEGISKNVYLSLKKKCEKNGGCWMWISTSKSTDFLNQGKNKKSYVLGAVYVSGVMKTKEYNKQYQKQRLKSEYRHSKKYQYQAIIPSHEYARLELETHLIVHDQVLSECRWSGLWTPYNGASILRNLMQKKHQFAKI